MHAVLLILLALVSAGLDLIGLTAIIPVFAIIFEPESLSEFPDIQIFIVDVGITSRKSLILFSIISVSSLFLLKNIVSLVLTFLQQRFNYNVAVGLSEKLLKEYYNRGLDFFKTKNSYLILRNLTSIPMEYSQQIVQSVMNIFSEGIIILIISLSIFLVNPIVLFISILAFLPAYLIFYYFSKQYMAHVNKQRSEIYVDVNNFLSRLIHGFEEVILGNAKIFFQEKYLKSFYRVGKYSAFQQVFTVAPNKVMEFLAVLSLFAISVYLIYAQTDTKELLMTLSFFAAAAYRLIPTSNKLINALSSLKSFNYVFEVYQDLSHVESPVELVDHLDQETNFLKPDSVISIDNLSYAYANSSNNALTNINLKISSGDVIGLIGSSGGGKTTLVNIILGFYKPTSGTMDIDGINVHKQMSKSWFSNLGYVRQNVYVFDLTIMENIALGEELEMIDVTKVQEALAGANLLEYCESLENGIYTLLEENGSNLSGGQRQRIAIARALYSDCSLLVFDEATSALDAETEKQITEEIRNLKNLGKTIIVVAHRHTSLKYCDFIYRLVDGELIEKLSYEDIK